MRLSGLEDMFASLFSDKISKIRDTFSTAGSLNDAPDSVPPAFNAFMPVTEDEVHKCISESPTKSCSLDSTPTFLLKDCLDILLPSITKLVNYPLIEGSFPNSFKNVVVTPLIKKASLPRNNLKNYRPVSGFCFLSKLVERRKVLHCTSETVLPAHSSDKSLEDMFASLFSNKISKIRDKFSTAGSFNGAPDSVSPAFNAFMPVIEDEVHKCISESPTKSCSLDPIPTSLLKDCLDILLPSITKLVNYPFIEGSFPNSFKKVVVIPLIKKASLPRNNLKNYRPVSGFCFLSKLVEQVIAKQLKSHTNNNKLDNPHQSAYKPGHSTETA